MHNKNDDFNPKIFQTKMRFTKLRESKRRRWVPRDLKNSVVELLHSGIPRAVLAKEFAISYAQMRDWGRAFVKQPKPAIDTVIEKRTLTVVPTAKPQFHFSLNWVWRGMSVRFLFGEIEDFAQ